MNTISTASSLSSESTSLLDFKKSCTTSEFPNKFARHVMEKGKVYYWPSGGFHIVTDVSLAKFVLKSDSFSADRSSFFLSRMPNLDLNLIHDFFSVVKKMMVMSDGSEHTRRRRSATAGFDDHVLDRFETKVAETVQRLLQKAFSKPKVEFVKEIASELPATVLADLFSIPHADRIDFLTWSNNMTAFFGGASKYENPDGIKVNQAASKLREYFRELLRLRRSHPGDDYISSLIRTQTEFNLTDDEVISQAIMMLVAGQVTTTDQICNTLFLIADSPDLQLQLRQNPKLIPDAIEECKRFDPAVTFLFRVAKSDVLLGDQSIKAGETVFISNHAVNRDLALETPFKLDIHRNHPTKHFAYGHGPHYCLGAKLGRLQMRLLFQQLLSEMPFFSIDREQGARRDHYSLSFSGFSQIPLVHNGMA